MRSHLLFAIAVVAILVPFSTLANGLILPKSARLLGNRTIALDSYSLAVGTYDAGKIPMRKFEGRVERQSWRLNEASVTTLQVLAPLRDQLSGAGYEILFECRDISCGGFDFRFAIDVIPAPDMHVNIRDFRYLAAVRGDNEALSLLISRTGASTYVQAIHVTSHLNVGPGTTDGDIIPGDPPAKPDPPSQSSGLLEMLEAQGHVVLSDLIFESGAERLGPGSYASLMQLAEYLKKNPSHRIALVGHTDSVGSLSSNISLSKRRAGSVRARMIAEFAIAPARIEAEGMGYLAPVASNLTRAGRDANRRVEAILLSK